MSYKKFIVERLPDGVQGANTIEDLRRYLETPITGPHPLHNLNNLISCEFNDGDFFLVWALNEKKLSVKGSEDFV